MNGISLVPIFMIGLLGSVHCIGMCGGIVGALSAASAARPRFPVAVVAGEAAERNAKGPAAMPLSGMLPAAAFDSALRVMAYNAGRIGSYMAAGAIAGAVGNGLLGGVRTLSDIAPLQLAGYWLANLMLIALGLYLMDAWRGLTALEAAGQVLWRRIRPWMKSLLPLDSAWKAFAVGGLWGWVPCGMVYSVLLTAMLSGSVSSGAGVMLAFGLGTLPMLLGMGLLGMRLQAWLRRRDVRIACGMLVLAFGLLGLVRAAGGMPHGWSDAFCLSPPAAGGSR